MFQCHAKLIGNQLADVIYLCKGISKNAANVPDHGPGGHCSERDDLTDMIASVLSCDVVDHFLTAFVTEIHVDIGHGNALGIQEPFKEE